VDYPRPVAFTHKSFTWFSSPTLLPGLVLVWTGLWLLAHPSLGAEEKTELSSAGYFSQEWTVDDGLPHNIINHIVQDHQGYLWMASVAGLVRFDGRVFKEFSLEKNPGEASYNIRDLNVDPSGALLMLPASGGIVQFQNKVARPHPATAAMGGRNSSNLFVEPNGAIWADAEGGELIRWFNGQSEVFHRGREIPSPSGHYFFALDARNRLWIGTGEYLGHYEGGKLIWRPEKMGASVAIAPSRSGGLWINTSERLMKMENDVLSEIISGPTWMEATDSSVQQLLEDRSGNLWIGTRRKGLWCLSKNKLQPIPTPADNITSLLQDSEDNIWVGTHGGGVSRLRPKAFISLENSAGSTDSLRTSLCEDSRGALWFANRSGALERHYQGQVERFTVHPTGRPVLMYLVCPDKQGLIWVCTSGALYTISVDHPTELVPHPSGLRDVRIILCARNGDVWVVHGDGGIGTFHDGVFREYSDNEDRLPKRIRVLAEAPDGSIWIGSGERSLLQYTGGKFVERFNSQQVPGGSLTALLIDPEGTFWLGTTHGLVLKQGARFKRFGLEEGLSDELISQLLEDDRGRLWCANRRGFSAVPRSDYYAVAEGRQTRVREATLGKDDGLPKAFALSGLPPMPWKAHDGRLWFSVHGGFIGIDPGASLPQRNPPPVYIDEVEIDQQFVTPTAPLRLSAGDHQVTFRFSAVNFSSPEKIHLRHQLVGYDSGWIETGSDRTADYVFLPPGNYRMRVMARNQDGPWSEPGAELALVVPPAWWQTWSFRVAASLALATVFAWLVRHWSQRRLRTRLEALERENQLERERSRIARDLHDELGYSVTQIGLIADRLKSDSSVADLKDGLGELASCTRRLSGELDGVVWTVSPKNDKWDRLAAYIRQFTLNFFADTSIACTVTGVEDAPPTPLEPEVQHHLLAILKESLNNILKHARATRVELSLAFVDQSVSLHIIDNGIGFDPAAAELSERNGLTNLRARALEIGGKLDIVSSPQRGTELTLSLHLNAKPRVRPPSVS